MWVYKFMCLRVGEDTCIVGLDMVYIFVCGVSLSVTMNYGECARECACEWNVCGDVHAWMVLSANVACMSHDTLYLISKLS